MDIQRNNIKYCTHLSTTVKGVRLEGSMQTEKLDGHWEIVNFPPPSLLCFTAEGLALSWVSFLGQTDRQGLTVRFVS